MAGGDRARETAGARSTIAASEWTGDILLLVHFQILSEITQVETIARGNSIRKIKRLRRVHGRARWRKLKGIARVELEDGTRQLA